MSNSDIEQVRTVKGHIPNGASLSGRISNVVSLSGHISIGSGAGDFIIRMTIEVDGNNYTVTSCDKTMEQIDAAVASGQNIKAIALDKYVMPMIQMEYSESYTFGAFLGSFLVAANVAKSPESGTDDWEFYLYPITADIVEYYNDAMPRISTVGGALDKLIPNSHTHSNKAVLDKFAETDGKPTYNGEALGGDFIIEMTVASDGNDNYTVTSCDATVEQIDAAYNADRNIVLAVSDHGGLDRYILPLVQASPGVSYMFQSFFSAYLFSANISERDGTTFAMTQMPADVIAYYNNALPTVADVKTALDALVTKSHTHANKDILDKLSDSNGKLQYNGSDVGLKVDQTYSPTSENAQSGKAVAEAVASKADKTEVNKLNGDLAELSNKNVTNLSDVEFFGNLYVNRSGIMIESLAWEAYKVTQLPFVTLTFSGLTNDLGLFSVAFYSTRIPTDSDFLGGAHLPSFDGTVVLSKSDIPDGTKCVLLCSRTKGAVNTELEIIYDTMTETVRNTERIEELKQETARNTERIEELKQETVRNTKTIEYLADETDENMLTSTNKYGQYYISADGTPTMSFSWDSYLLFGDYFKYVFECYTNSVTFYSVGFYSDTIPSAGTFLGGIKADVANQLTTITFNDWDIPAGTKSILFCTRSATGSNSTLTRVSTIKNVVDMNVKVIEGLVNENNGRGNVKAIYKKIPNSNDFTIIKNEIWFSQNIYKDGVATEYSKIHRYKIVNDSLIHISDIDSDFGHWNTVDYCEENDCLIFSNSANLETTEGNWFCVVKNPLALGSTARIAECGIKYNVDIGFKVQAVWGDNNFGQYNIVYLTSNYSNRVVKVLLLKDENGDFNGEYITLEDKTLTLENWASGGGDFYGDTLYIGLGIRYRLGMLSMTDYSTKEIEKHYYYADGTEYSGSTQGVHVDSKYIWVFSNVAGKSENYLIQYYR